MWALIYASVSIAKQDIYGEIKANTYAVYFTDEWWDDMISDTARR